MAAADNKSSVEQFLANAGRRLQFQAGGVAEMFGAFEGIAGNELAPTNSLLLVG